MSTFDKLLLEPETVLTYPEERSNQHSVSALDSVQLETSLFPGFWTYWPWLMPDLNNTSSSFRTSFHLYGGVMHGLHWGESQFTFLMWHGDLKDYLEINFCCRSVVFCWMPQSFRDPLISSRGFPSLDSSIRRQCKPDFGKFNSSMWNVIDKASRAWWELIAPMLMLFNSGGAHSIKLTEERQWKQHYFTASATRRDVMTASAHKASCVLLFIYTFTG